MFGHSATSSSILLRMQNATRKSIRRIHNISSSIFIWTIVLVLPVKIPSISLRLETCFSGEAEVGVCEKRTHVSSPVWLGLPGKENVRHCDKLLTLWREVPDLGHFITPCYKTCYISENNILYDTLRCYITYYDIKVQKCYITCYMTGMWCNMLYDRQEKPHSFPGHVI